MYTYTHAHTHTMHAHTYVHPLTHAYTHIHIQTNKHSYTTIHTHTLCIHTLQNTLSTFAGGPLVAVDHTQNTDKIQLLHDQTLLVQTMLDNTEYHNMASRYAIV